MPLYYVYNIKLAERARPRMTTEEDMEMATTTFPHRGLAPALLAVGAWLALSALLAANGTFTTPPSQPPLPMLLAIAIPPCLFALAIARIPAFRAWVLAIDPVFLTSIQALRVVGAGFLFLYAFGNLPGLFAIPAGWGDVLVGVLAPFAAATLAANPAFLRSRRLEYFHYLGLLDFAGAIGSGLLARGMFGLVPAETGTSVLGQLPLSLIPGFAVPLWICLHIAALTQIRHARAHG